MRTYVFQTTEPHADVRSNLHQLRRQQSHWFSYLGWVDPTALGRNALPLCEFR